MARLTGTREVDKMLKAASRQLRKSVRQANLQAARLVSRGKYDRADELISLARGVTAFIPELDGLREKWQGVGAQRGERIKGKRAPLWMYYRPIAQALIEVGGSASLAELNGVLEQSLQGVLQPVDLVVGADGQPKWSKVLGRARGAMIREGYLERGATSRWTLSEQGRQLTKSSPKN